MKLSKFISKIYTYLSHMIIQIALILLVPIIILVTYSSFTNTFHINNYEELLISNYINELNFFLEHTEQKLDTIISSAKFLGSNPTIGSLLTTSAPPARKNASTYIATLKNATLFTNITDSIAIYNKDANFVVSSSDLYTPDEYFNNFYKYEDYNAKYWSDYHETTGNIKILPPTSIQQDLSGNNKNIVPLVFTSLDNIASNSLVIFNINVDSLLKELDVHKLTPNSRIYMKDNSKGNIYSHYDDASDISNSVFLRTIKESLHSSARIISYEGEDFLLIQSTDRANIWGYTYFVSIPYTDIHKSTTKLFMRTLSFMILIFFLLLLYIVFGSKFLYTPWKKIISTAHSVSDNDTLQKNTNPADYILNTMLNISNQNKDLHETLRTTLPLSQEKYLVDILNDNFQQNDEGNNILDFLSFKYDYFMTVAISIKINPVFLTEQKKLLSNVSMQKEIYKAIHSFFADNYATYELPATNNIYYILLNIDSDNSSDSIFQTLEDIKKLISVDIENLDVIFATGKIYQGFDGLKLTHQEAVSSIAKELTKTKIQIPITSNSKYIYSQNCENILSNYLVTGSTNKAKVLLNDIFDKICQDTPEIRKQVYSDITFTLEKILRRKGYLEADSLPATINSSLQEDDVLQDVKIQTEILKLVDAVSELMQTNSRTLSIENVIEYINEHYTENIYLDELAYKFNTSSKYLSRKISNYLNISFKEYITQLKISKAKSILETTDTNINDICSMCGFQDRGAFTRAFKLQTGLTPSTYRKQFNQNNTSGSL